MTDLEARYLMHELGVGEGIRRHEVSKAVSDLEFQRMVTCFKTSKIHYHLKVLGRPQEMTERDLEGMRRQFEDYRSQGWLDKLAEQSVYLRDIGLDYPMAKKELDGFAGYLQTSRKEGGAMDILRIHYLLKMNGFGQEVTADDKKIIKEHLQLQRHFEDPENVARILFYLKHILPEREKPQAPEMPPLKKIN